MYLKILSYFYYLNCPNVMKLTHSQDPLDYRVMGSLLVETQMHLTSENWLKSLSSSAGLTTDVTHMQKHTSNHGGWV